MWSPDHVLLNRVDASLRGAFRILKFCRGSRFDSGRGPTGGLDEFRRASCLPRPGAISLTLAPFSFYLLLASFGILLVMRPVLRASDPHRCRGFERYVEAAG